MKKLNQNTMIAGRKTSEILSRFQKKIKEPIQGPHDKPIA